MARADPKPILLAEDNEDDVLLFRRSLMKAGLTNPIHVVGDARSAMDYLLARGVYSDRALHPYPSVFLIDFHLPDMNGFELVQWVRAQAGLRGLHCVIFTGDHRPSIFRDCYAIGSDSFLYKPCNHQDLRNLADGFPQHWLSNPSA